MKSSKNILIITIYLKRINCIQREIQLIVLSSIINPNHVLDDLEYGINIEHIDLEVKEYSQLI